MAKSFSSTDLLDTGTWTNDNLDSNTVDQYGAVNNTNLCNGNERFTTNDSGILVIGDEDFSYGMWVKTTSIGSVNQTLMMHRNGVNMVVDFHLTTTNTIYLAVVSGAFSNNVVSISSTVLPKDVWVWVGYTVEMLASGNADLNIYTGSEDGLTFAEVAYGTQDAKAGAGYTGVTQNQPLTLAARVDTATLYLHGTPSRPSMWKEVADLSAEYASEICLRDGCATGVTQDMVSPMAGTMASRMTNNMSSR